MACPLTRRQQFPKRAEDQWGLTRPPRRHPAPQFCRWPGSLLSDVSVTSTLQPGNLNRALSNAGVAAREAEMRKDAKYEEHVHRHGGRFVPLVVESLGFWSPFATTTLRAIAERTTLKNSLESKAAFSNLSEQLSMKLWTFNAKMVLNYLFLHTSSDPLWEL